MTVNQRSNSTYTWLRSGDSSYYYSACNLNSTGGDFSDNNVGSSRGVRPSLHINLESAAQAAGALGEKVSSPTVSPTSATYDGTAKYFAISDLNTEAVEISTTATKSSATMTYDSANSRLVATAADTYTVTFKLKDKSAYRWSGGGTDDNTTTITISKGELTAPSLTNYDENSCVYKNENYNFTFGTFDTTKITVTPPSGSEMTYDSGTRTLSAKNAGTYNVTISIADTDNYKWAGDSDSTASSAKTISVKISSKVVEISPSDVTLGYSASGITAENIKKLSWYANDNASLYDASIDITLKNGSEVKSSVKDVGSYTIVLSLKDKSNYAWTSSGDVNDKSVALSITKRTLDSSAITNVTREYSGTTYDKGDLRSESWWEDDFGNTAVMSIQFKNGTTDVEGVKVRGAYTVEFTLVDTVNYAWSDGSTTKTITFTITQKTISVTLANGSDNSPKVDSDGNPTGYVFDGIVSGDEDNVSIAYRYTNSAGYNSTTRPTERGTYTITIELVDKTGNYVLSSDTQTTYEDCYTYNGKAIEFTANMLLWQYTDGNSLPVTVEYKKGQDDYNQYSSSSPFTVVYSGNAFSFGAVNTISGKTLADYGVKVTAITYSTNGDAPTNAGSYTVTLKLEEYDTTWADYEKTFTLYYKIDKAMYDLSGLQWQPHDGAEIEYTGSYVETTITTTLPTGLSATYEYSKDGKNYSEQLRLKDIGSYYTMVVFTVDSDHSANYYVPTYSADGDYSNNCIVTNGTDTFSFILTWSITKATVEVVWSNSEYQLTLDDGSAQTIKIPKLADKYDGILDYAYYEYDENKTNGLGTKLDSKDDLQYSKTELKEYYVVVTLKTDGSADNYSLANDKQQKYFVVGGVSQSVVIVVDSSYVYGSTTQYVKFDGNTTCTTDCLTITYYKQNSNTALSATPTNVGSYRVTVAVKDGYTDYYTISGDTTFNFTITKKQLDLSAIVWDYSAPFTYSYDGEEEIEYKVELTGFTEETEFLKDLITYDNNKATTADTRTASYSYTLDTNNYEVVKGISASSTLTWKIAAHTIAKPADMLDSLTFANVNYNLLNLCGLDPDWQNYLTLTVYKDDEIIDTTNNATQVKNAGNYILKFAFKDAVKGNILWVDSDGTTYRTAAQVYCTINKVNIVVTGWSSKPPVPTFTDETISSSYYYVVYENTETNEKMTEDEAAECYDTICIAYVMPTTGMEDNVTVSYASGNDKYEWYQYKRYHADATVDTYTAPDLTKNEFEYSGEVLSIVSFLNNYDDEAMIVGGDVQPNGAGSYTIYISLDGLKNAKWEGTGDDQVIVINYTIAEGKITVEWNTSGAIPVLSTNLPDGAITYKFYKNNSVVSKNNLKDGETYEVIATLSGDYANNYDFTKDGSQSNSTATTFTYVKANENNGGTGTNGGGTGSGNGSGDVGGGTGSGTSGNNGTNDNNGTSGASENGSGTNGTNDTNGSNGSNNAADNNGTNNGGNTAGNGSGDSADIGNGDITTTSSGLGNTWAIVILVTFGVVIVFMLVFLASLFRRRKLIAEHEAESAALKSQIKAHEKTIAAKQRHIDKLEGNDGGFNDTATTPQETEKKKKSLFSRKKK
jgi:hypothetical protein